MNMNSSDTAFAIDLVADLIAADIINGDSEFPGVDLVHYVIWLDHAAGFAGWSNSRWQDLAFELGSERAEKWAEENGVEIEVEQ